MLKLMTRDSIIARKNGRQPVPIHPHTTSCPHCCPRSSGAVRGTWQRHVGTRQIPLRHRGKSRCNTATTLRTGRADASHGICGRVLVGAPQRNPRRNPAAPPRLPRAPRHPWETCDMPRTAVRSPYQRGGPQSPWLLLAQVLGLDAARLVDQRLRTALAILAAPGLD